jgi:hypothetical protein
VTTPRVDTGRLRARLSPAHLAALGALVAGADTAPQQQTASAELRDAGLLDAPGRDPGVHPLLVDVVRTLAAAQVVLDVETSGPEGRSGHGISVAGERACLVQGWPGDDVAEYALIAPRLAVPALAVACGLTAPGPGAAGAPAPVLGEVSAPLRVVEEALRALGAADTGWAAARTAAVEVVSAHLVDDAAARLVDVLAALRRALRITATVPRTDTPARGLVALDAGPQGWWVRTVPAEPLSSEALVAAFADPDTVVRLEPRTPGQLWRALVDLVPAA